MANQYTTVLSSNDLSYISNLPEVGAARTRLDTYSGSANIYFSIDLTESVRASLLDSLGLNLSGVSSIPLRWVKGDTAPHVDLGHSRFNNTYLVYLTNSPGSFIVDSGEYPITENTCYVFSEGLSHETTGTSLQPRLLLGPMNEFGQSVGGSPIQYFSNQAHALAITNTIAYSPDTVVGNISSGSIGAITTWLIASNSVGSSSQLVTYTNGQTLNNDGIYYLYPATACFLEGTRVLCQVNGLDVYLPIEQMTKGMLVKTNTNGYKPVVHIGRAPLVNPGTEDRIQDRLYMCSPSKYPELTSDVFITGCHSILVDSLTEAQEADIKKRFNRIFITENKYRLMACIDERATPWTKEGTYTVWNFALENDTVKANYGVFVNGGLLVETCCIQFMIEKSNMELL